MRYFYNAMEKETDKDAKKLKDIAVRTTDPKVKQAIDKKLNDLGKEVKK